LSGNQPAVANLRTERPAELHPNGYVGFPVDRDLLRGRPVAARLGLVIWSDHVSKVSLANVVA
ncbi:MAG TPA: hypothetical protein VGI52_10385, partial [Solirubrobacteraceae bacterium]